MPLNTQVQQITQLPEYQKAKKEWRFVKNEKMLKSGKKQLILHNAERVLVVSLRNCHNSAKLRAHLLGCKMNQAHANKHKVTIL